MRMTALVTASRYCRRRRIRCAPMKLTIKKASQISIQPAANPRITAVVVRAGKIEAIGPQGAVESPPGAIRHEVGGRTIMPGLICTHSHIGGIGGADRSEPIQPAVRVYDSINVRDPGFRRVAAGGLTALNIMPGSGHLMSGQTVYVKVRPGETIDDIAIRWELG